MAVVNDLTALSKAVFGDNGCPNLVPDFAIMQKDIAFKTGKQLGDFFEFPVRLRLPKGITKAKGDGTAGAFTLNTPVAGTVAKTKLYGFQSLLRDRMSVEDAAKLAKAGEKGYEEGATFFYEGMNESIRRYNELDILYGSCGFARTTTTSANASATSTVVSINASYWADGIYAGAENEQIQFYKVSNDALVSTGADSVFTISSIDFENKKITVTGTATGITALDIAIAAGAHNIYVYSGFGNEMQGIHSMLSATSGTVMNINVATYGLWHGTQYAPTSGEFSWDKAKVALSMALGRGGLMEGCTLYLNNKNFDDVVSDIIALKRINDNTVSSVELGVDEVIFKHAAGRCVLKGHPMIWEGFAYGLAKPKKYWSRVGAADVTNKMPGMGDEMFRLLSDNAGVESWLYTHQTVATEALAKSFVISGLVPGSGT